MRYFTNRYLVEEGADVAVPLHGGDGQEHREDFPQVGWVGGEGEGLTLVWFGGVHVCVLFFLSTTEAQTYDHS